MKLLPRKWRVLVADDFAEHCIMLACAIRQTDRLQVVHTVSTGQQAINYFIGKGPYAERETFPLPRVLITELDMPCADGRKLLVRLGNECFPRPIVVVLTASPLPDSRQEAQQLGADAFFVKPERFRDLVVVVREIERLAIQTFGSWAGSGRHHPEVPGGESR